MNAIWRRAWLESIRVLVIALAIGLAVALLVSCGGEWEPCYEVEPLCPPFQAPVCVCSSRAMVCDWKCGVPE